MEELQRDLEAANVAPETRAKILAREAPRVEVQSWNKEPVRVFQLCDFTIQVAMDGAHYLGIAAAEIETVARAMGLAWDVELLACVKVMGNAASAVKNQRRAAASRPSRT